MVDRNIFKNKKLIYACILGLFVNTGLCANAEGINLSNKPIDTPTLTYLNAQDDTYPQSGYTLATPSAGATDIITKYTYDATTNTLTSTNFEVKIKDTVKKEDSLLRQTNPTNDINGNFVEVFQPVDDYYTYGGGAIYNESGTFNNITGNFIKNYTTYYNGGAIYNYKSLIENIKGDFIGNHAENGYGGAIYNSYGTITNITGDFIKNYSYEGGAIYNYGGTINNINGDFLKNYTDNGYNGGAIYNGAGTINNITGNFTENNSLNGGAIYNSGTIRKITGDFIGNSVSGSSANGGAIYNLGTIGKIENYVVVSGITGNFINNYTDSKQGKGGAIYNSSGCTINIINSLFADNKANEGGAIYNNTKGKINIINVTFAPESATAKNDIYNAGTIDFKGTNILASEISGNGNGILYFGENGYSTISAQVSNQNIQMNNAHINLTSENLINGNNLEVMNVSSLNILNDNIGSMSLNELSLSADLDVILDVDLANAQMDTISADSLKDSTGNINVYGFNLLSDLEENEKTVSILFVNDVLKDNVTTDVTEVPHDLQTTVYTPIYKYNVTYESISNGDESDGGYFNFSRPSGGGSSSSDSQDFNPAILASPIAAQLGGYLTLLNTYDNAFRNMDMYMLMTKEQRQALKYKNKYATTNSNIAYNTKNTPYDNTAGWFRPYATFESVGLKNGPKVNNVAYGTYAGLESEMTELGNGWDGTLSLYAGYTGSHQTYQGNSIYQNGGNIGLVGMAYKGNFFTGLTASVGSSVGQANTMYGKDDFTMLMSGVAAKTGYNFEFADGKFIIQPNYTMSYSMVNTFDYTNAAGVRLSSDPLHAIHIEPGIKLIANLKNGWQPYAGVSVVMNILDDTKFKANDVTLPELSVKPYAKYGVGLRKTWGERFVGYFQTFITSGGRNGVGLQTGFRWTLGKDKSDKKEKSKA